MSQSSLSVAELESVLTLIASANQAKTPEEMRQIITYGTGAMFDSINIAWTELKTDLFEKKFVTILLADSDSIETTIEFRDKAQLLKDYAWQHPVVSAVVNNRLPSAKSISEFMSQSSFRGLELYLLFYKTMQIEDQLTVASLHGDTAIGLSVNRGTWGFTDNERALLTHIGNGVFPYYQKLKEQTNLTELIAPVVNLNIDNFPTHAKKLGITKRESELLTLVGHGKSNQQIAVTCEISEGTVRKHLENAYRRLGVNNRVSAIIEAIKIINQAGD